MCLQGLREPPGSCKLLQILLLVRWHGRGHRFDPDQVHQSLSKPLPVILSFLFGQQTCIARIEDAEGKLKNPRAKEP